MAKRTINGLPEFKAPPPPPKETEKKKAPNEVSADILEILRQYSPEQQNLIIAETLKETTYWRHQEMILQREKLCQAEGIFKQFLDLQHVGESVMKELENKKGF